jgi:uncharacterized protein
MVIYIDTSAFYAGLCADDPNHQISETVWRTLLLGREELVCNNYVLLEIISLVQARLGMVVVDNFRKDFLPMLRIDWLGEFHHNLALATFLAYRKRHLSLVDCSSFETMSRLGIRTAFAFDPHFAEQGFDTLPPL